MEKQDSYLLNIDNRELVEKKFFSKLITKTSVSELRMSEFQIMKYARTVGMDLRYVEIEPSTVGNVNKFSKLIFE